MFKLLVVASVALFCHTWAEYTCADGTKMADAVECDGNVQCDDWSDEFNDNCETTTYKRADGAQVSVLGKDYKFECDGYKDCSDGSDEANCNKTTTSADKPEAPQAQTEAPQAQTEAPQAQTEAPQVQPEAPADSSNAPPSGWQAKVLDKHNELRSKIAMGEQENKPPAKYMGKMVWDEELAAEAQKYADTCPEGNGDRENGELIGDEINWSSNETQTKIVQDGYDSDVKDAEIDQNGFIKTSCVNVNGRFTQIVWATSVKIGCGWKLNCDSWNRLVCRYRPPGNKNRYSEPVYIPGKTCELCDGTCEKGLCDGPMKAQVVEAADLPPGLKADVLNKHNELRSKIAQGQQAMASATRKREGQQPNMASAKYMRKMYWDDALAAETQKYADGCPADHAENIRAGENMALNSEPNSWSAMVKDWYSEIKDAPAVTDTDSGIFGGKGTGVIGHFTQLIWAESYKLGCGYKTGCNGMNELICRYLPPGNFNQDTEPVYIPGKTCELCDGTCENGLCDGEMKS